MKKIGIIILIVSAIISLTCFMNIKAVDNGKVFIGQNGSPEGEELFNATNTYNYIPIVDGEENVRTHEFYNTSIPNNNINKVRNSAAQITVLTHGLGGDASHFSNNGNSLYSHNENSIVARLNEEIKKNTGNYADIYIAKMKSTSSFELYYVNNCENVDLDNITISPTRMITDISKDIIILFNSCNENSYNYIVYQELNYMLSKIVYDVKILNNGFLPKINLIGHSRGGLTNLQYVLDHPKMIDKVFSIGTPYFGSNTAATSIGRKIAGNSDGVEDIIDSSVYLSYYDRWVEGYNDLYADIDYHALGGYSDVNFLFDALIEFNNYKENNNIPVNIDIPSNSVLESAKNLINTKPMLVNLVGAGLSVVNFVDSFFDGLDCNEDDLDWIVKVINNVEYPYIETGESWFFSYLLNVFSIIYYSGTPIFKNDLLVNLTSQLGIDEYSDEERKYNFNIYEKCFLDRDYEENNGKYLSNNYFPAIVHNLETRDNDFINYIISNIEYNDEFVYEILSNDTAKVVGFRGEVNNGMISIPSTIGEYDIVEIGSNIFYGFDEITTINIPSSITTISRDAFINLSNLERLNIANNSNLQYIGDRAFAGCVSLSTIGNTHDSIILPNNVSYIGVSSFNGVDAEKILIPSSVTTIEKNAFSNTNSLTEFQVSSNNVNYFSLNGVLYSYDGYIIKYPIAKNETSFTVPSSYLNTEIIGIGDECFMNLSSLTNINFSQIHTIGNNAFSGCNGLTSITIPNTTYRIGDYAFYNCNSLNTINITREKDSITHIGINSFGVNNSDLSISVPLSRVGDYKHDTNWLVYDNNIQTDYSTIEQYTLNNSCDFSFNTELEAGYKKLYKLVVSTENCYKITCTANNDVWIFLYGSEMNQLGGTDGNTTRIIERTLAVGTYYLSIGFDENSSYGIISTNMKQVHQHNYLYRWKTTTRHLKICSCGISKLEPHYVSQGSFTVGQMYATCLLCGGNAEVGFVPINYSLVQRTYITENGSYILPNGVVVLAIEDIESFLNGELVYDDSSNTSNIIDVLPLSLLKKEEYFLND